MNDPFPLPDDFASSSSEANSPLFDDEWILDAFETEWRSRDTPPSIASHLARAVAAGLDEQSTLVELVRIDLEYRWRSPQPSPRCVEEYREEFPQLEITRDLLADEVRLRHRRGESLRAAEWMARFPRDAFRSDLAYGEWCQFLEGLDTSRESTSRSSQLGNSEETAIPDVEPGNAVSPVVDDWSAISQRFERESLLGQGSFGSVWRAFDRQLERRVAIKTLHPSLAVDPEFRESLASEARVAAQLTHTDLVTIHDVIASDSQVYVVMRWIDGVPLDAWWNRQSRSFNETERTERYRRLALMLARVSSAVHHAHLAGLVHCDLKPQNILVDSSDHPTVLDFGLAVSRSVQSELGPKIMGTPAYMSPEQTWGEVHNLDGRADVWSLGVILYRLLTDHLPFEASSNERVFEAIQTRSLVPPGQFRDDLPKGLVTICERSLSKRIDDRYATARELAEALQWFAGTQMQGHATRVEIDSSTGALSKTVKGLPWTESELVGRDDCIAKIIDDVTDRDRRLVTLSGVGGIGKTQTAAAVARRLVSLLPHEVVWVNVAAATDVQQFAGAVLAALNIPPQPNESAQDRVSHSLAVRGPCLLVLDNVEQIVRDVAPVVTDWLSRVDSLRFIVTSQVPLRVPGESIHVLTSLFNDERDDAVLLFELRARAIFPDFELTADAWEEVCEICRLVDGNPLAIELAAARVGILGVSKLRQRLGESFAILKNTRSGHPVRHQTLHDVVKWSFGLLDASLQEAFLTVAVWPSPLGVETAEWMIESSGCDPLDALDELTQRNLLRIDEVGGERIVSGSTVVQRFAKEVLDGARMSRIASRLIERVKEDWVDVDRLSPQEATHLANNLWAANQWLPCENIADPCEAALCREQRIASVLVADRLAEDVWDSSVRLERLVSCWDAATGIDRLEMALRLADAKRLFGEREEAESLVREAIAGSDSAWKNAVCDGTPHGRKRIQRIAVSSRRLLAMMLFRHGQPREAIALLEDAIEVFLTDANEAANFDVLLELAEIHRRLGDTDEASRRLKQGERFVGPEALKREAVRDESNSQDARRARWVTERGKVALQRGQIDQAKVLFEEAVALLDGRYEARELQQALLGRAATSAELGDFAAAGIDYDQCEMLSRRLGDLPTLAQSLNNRALAYDDSGDSHRCCETLDAALEIYRRLGDSLGQAIALIAKAAAVLQLGRPAETLEILDSPQVQSVVSQNSIHYAIVLGDRGTALARLGQFTTAKEYLDRSLACLAQLGIDRSAEQLLYQLERADVLRQLESSQYGEARCDIAKILEEESSRLAPRKRLVEAVLSFRTGQ